MATAEILSNVIGAGTRLIKARNPKNIYPKFLFLHNIYKCPFIHPSSNVGRARPSLSKIPLVRAPHHPPYMNQNMIHCLSFPMPDSSK